MCAKAESLRSGVHKNSYATTLIAELLTKTCKQVVDYRVHKNSYATALIAGLLTKTCKRVVDYRTTWYTFQPKLKK